MRLALKNILYFWKTHILIALCLALACGVIVASLIVGDSLSKTLENKALNRLGQVETYVEKIGSYTDASIAKDASAVLALDAIASANGLSRAVKFYVVDDSFWEHSLSGKAQDLSEGIALNNSAVLALNLREDSEVALRFAIENSALVEIPLSDAKAENFSANFSITKFLSPEDFGDFYLYDWQNSPPNIFISYDYFCKKFNLGKYANLFLSKNKDLKDSFSPSFENLGLFYKTLGDSYIIKSKNVFIADEITNQIPYCEKTLAWFVSKIDFEGGQDYNAFLVGAGVDLQIGEVEINEVYAKEYSLSVGDTLGLSYYVFDEKLDLKLESVNLKIAKISPINSAYFVEDIVPEYDGLTNVEDCSQWKSSIPIDLKKITASHKDYWAKYKATPKLRVSYELAKSLFSRSMGDATALVFEGDIDALDFSKVGLESLGFFENYPRQSYLDNAKNGVDFKGLFIGLSFFIIINSMLLIGLVFNMNLRSRFEEIHLFKYLGIRLKAIENFYLKEFFLSIVFGVILGGVFGFVFAEILIFMLNSIWGGISDGARIFFSYEKSSLVAGIFVSGLLGFALLKFFTKKFFRSKKLERLRALQSSKINLSVAGVSFILLLSLGVFGSFSLGVKSILSLFVYVFGVYLSVGVFRKMPALSARFTFFSFLRIGIAGSLSKSVYVILSLGVYLLCVVGLNEIDTSSFASKYSYVVKTFVSAKVPEQEQFKLLPLRVKQGASANCLNLNKVTQAQVLGADIDALLEGGVISIKESFAGEVGENSIKMYVDESSMIWSLKASLGDEFEYDTKLGKVNLKLVGALNPSIFQGSFIIAEDDFKLLWGGDSGYNIFLAEPVSNASEVELAKIFSQYLPDVDKGESILRRFDSLQNAYLKIFYQLGILGLILGLLGSLISIRSALILEQKHLAMMHLLGLRRSFVSKIFTAKYLIMNLGASLLGIVASLPLIRIEGNCLKVLLILLIVLIFNILLYPILRKFLRGIGGR